MQQEMRRERARSTYPRRMAPLGDPHAFFKPISLTCTALGVMVGSLKMEHRRDPDATASCSTLSSVASRALHDKSKNSHLEMSMCGLIH